LKTARLSLAANLKLASAGKASLSAQCGSIGAISPRDSRPATLHQLLNITECGHRRISGRRHRQRAVRRAAIDGVLHALVHQEAIDQSRRKRIAAADAI